MKHLSAKTGWLWINQGWTLFWKQPTEMLALFLVYMLIMLSLSIIPIIGQALSLILVPIFTMSFMQACLYIEKGQRVYPNLLLINFLWSKLSKLLILGILYLLIAFITIAISMLIDDGIFWKAITNSEINHITIKDSNNIRVAIIITIIMYIPTTMAFWFAAPLIVWQKMSLGKALFYSFFAVYSAGKAFIVYMLTWIGIGILIPVIINIMITLFINNVAIIVFILLPLSMILSLIMYCSFYPTYTTIFGDPQYSNNINLLKVK